MIIWLQTMNIYLDYSATYLIFVSGLYYNHTMIINDSHRWHHNLEGLSRGIIYSITMYLESSITIVNYDRNTAIAHATVATILNRDHISFIVQDTGIDL
jgi:hypothetical protein